MKINSRIKLIALSVSMMASLGAVAAGENGQTANQATAQSQRQPIKQENGQYTVRSGETLNQIAARIRPNNMTLADTAKALMHANPNIFKNNNPNLIFPGDVLRIPSAREFAGVSKGDTASAAPRSAPVEGPRIVMAPPPTAAKTKPVENTAPVKPAANGQASKPVVVAQESVDSESSSASAAADNTASQAAAVTAETAPTEGSGSSLPWILIGAIGLAALLILSRLRSKGKHETPAPAVITPREQGSNKAAGTAAAAAGAVTAASAKSQADDDIFFNDADEKPASTGQKQVEDEFDLDLGAIDSQQGIVSGAVTNDAETQKRAEIDWDAVESTESVFEDDVVPAPFEPAKPIVESESQTFSERAPEPEPLAFEPAVFEPEPAKIESIEAEEDSVLAFETVEETVEETVKTDEEAEQEAPLEFELPEQNETAAPVVKETTSWASPDVIKSPIIEPVEKVVAEEPVVTEPTPALAEEAIEEPKATLEPEEAVFEPEVVASQPLPVEAEPEIEAVTSAAEKVVEAPVSAAADVVETVEDFSNTHITEAGEDDVIEWDTIDLGGDDEEVGFISESVGMTAPLEAKYELAQMYIEIGDPDAARETLNELLEEASGDILDKSKALLSEIS